MIPCTYRKQCLKDISQLLNEYKNRIIKILFEDIPHADRLSDCRLDIYPIKGNPDHYRMRVGKYRVGFVIENETIIFARVKSREEIYSLFQ
jgi:mRNA-degrading endonuclease RelE of RelBE toxin-antitoxin system